MPCVVFCKMSRSRPATLHFAPTHVRIPNACLPCSSCGAGARPTNAQALACTCLGCWGAPKGTPKVHFFRAPSLNFFACPWPPPEAPKIFCMQPRAHQNAPCNHTRGRGQEPLHVGACAPWQATCTAPWPLRGVGVSGTPQIANDFETQKKRCMKGVPSSKRWVGWSSKLPSGPLGQV